MKDVSITDLIAEARDWVWCAMPPEDEFARWLHSRFGENQSNDWNKLSERLRIAWRDLADDSPFSASQLVKPETGKSLTKAWQEGAFHAARKCQFSADGDQCPSNPYSQFGESND
jgi:hypothetical protein